MVTHFRQLSNDTWRLPVAILWVRELYVAALCRNSFATASGGCGSDRYGSEL